MKCSRNERVPEDNNFDQLFARKLLLLEELAGVYEAMLVRTATREPEDLEKPMAEAGNLTEQIESIDARLIASGLPLLPPEPGAEVSALIQRLHQLNAGVIQAVADQQQEVGEKICEIEAQKRALRRFRPYRQSEGRRVNLSG